LAVAVLASVVVTPAWAQLQFPPGTPVPPTAPAEAPRRAPLTITPSISVLGEYNDNVFSDNTNKVGDFLIAFVPGITITLEEPTYRLLGSYSFTAEIYAQETQLNEAFSRHNLLVDGAYRATPLLTLSLTETLIVGSDTNLLATENVSTGRIRSFANTLVPAVAYQLNPRTTLRGRGTWTIQRYDSDGALDSDTYAAEAFADYAFTTRLTGSAGYQLAYFDVEDQTGITTHTPRVGATYRFTPFLTAALSGGPTIQVPEDGDSEVFAAVTASVQYRFAWGGVTAQYDRAIGTAGGLGGTTENQALGASLIVDRFMRGLVVQLSPRYSRERSTIGSSIEVDSFSVTLQARYEINRYMAAIGGYTFFRQRSDTAVITSAGIITGTDVDQNRVFVGLQFGYPITFD
jgi:hypothetical protein